MSSCRFARLLDEDHLVDPGCLHRAQVARERPRVSRSCSRTRRPGPSPSRRSARARHALALEVSHSVLRPGRASWATSALTA
jgi:hypothetical protein